VASIAGMRKHLPLIVFVLLVLVVVMLVGLACACLTDQPMQAIERALSSLLAAPAAIEVWGLVVILIGTPLFLGPRLCRVRGRASPALLQRFLL